MAHALHSFTPSLAKGRRRMPAYPSGVYLSPAIASIVVRASARKPSTKRELLRHTISKREREVLQLLMEGQSTKEVASTLYVSVKTIETHHKQIMDKLKLQHRGAHQIRNP